MAYKLSQRSLDRMIGVHPGMQRVVKRAITLATVDFRVEEGIRTLQRQRELLASGASRTLKSRHLTGHAVDLTALLKGKVSYAWPLYHQIAAAMKEAARIENVPIVWGGDWRTFKDGPHFELNRKVYP